MACKIAMPLLLTAVLCYSCNSSSVSLGFTTEDSVLAQAQSQALHFFAALKAGHTQKLKSLYNGIDKFPHLDGSDSVVLKGAWSTGNRIDVSVANRFTDIKKQAVEKRVSLFFKRKPNGGLALIDSKGLASFDNLEDYRLGLQTGCISKAADTTDQQILMALKRVRQLLPDKALGVYMELKKKVTLENWSWSLNSDGAFGEGVVVNNTSFVLPKLKYQIYFSNRKGDTLATDEGYVSYDELKSGERRAFTFFTDGVQAVSNASIELMFDDDLVFAYLTKLKWTGNECSRSARRPADDSR